jgi:hypothetical protein
MANNNSLNNISYGFTLPSLNLNFTSTAQRITGDMSNVTHANRLSFQTNVVNGATSPFIIPNGSGTIGQIVVANASDPTNSAFGSLQADSTSVKLVSNVLGTGVQLPMEIRIGATAAINIATNLAVTIPNATAGALALGVTASTSGGIQIDQANGGFQLFAVNQTSADAQPAIVSFFKSRTGGNINAADILGNIRFHGRATSSIVAAQMRVTAESIGASRVSGSIEFMTNSTAGTLAQRLNISADGAVSIPATVVGNVPLTITGTNAGGLVVNQATGGVASIYCVQSSADVQPVYINSFKNRAGGNINAGDVLGQSIFYGFATAYQVAAQMRVTAESVGAARVSGAFDWFTTSTAGVSAQRLNLTADGALVINTPVAALTALGVNGFNTAGTYAQQINAVTPGAQFSAFRALNNTPTAGSSCQIECSVSSQAAVTGGDAFLKFVNYGVQGLSLGLDTSVNQFSMSTSTLGDANTFFSYDIATTQINLPRQCSFMARKSATSLNATGNNSITIVFDAESFDVSNSYNNATGIFTAPKTGKYFFYATVRIEALTALMTLGQIQIAATGQSIFSNLINIGICRTITPNDINTLQVSGIISMTAGDTAQVQVTVLNGAGNTASIYGGAAAVNSTYFSGQLLS